MAGRRARHRARGGEDVPTLRASGTRLATGLGSVALLVGVAAVPLTRGDATFQAVDVRLSAVAFVALVAAVVRCWPALIPAAVGLVAGGYAVELAVDDASVDLAAPAVALGLFLAAELAYWSIDERVLTTGDPGLALRRAGVLATGAVAIFVLGSGLLTLVDEVKGRGVALDVLGAGAAAGVLVAVLLTARGQSSRGS